jgi:hypothetical protein
MANNSGANLDIAVIRGAYPSFGRGPLLSISNAAVR